MEADDRPLAPRRYAVFLGYLVLILAGAAMAVFQRQEGERQRHQLELKLGKSYYAVAVARAAAHQDPDAVAYLTGALRADPQNRDAASLLFSELTTHDWILPRGAFQPRNEMIVSVGANGHRALTLTENALHVWDIDTPRALREIDRPDGLLTASFTPDGRRVVLLTSTGSETVEVDSGAVSATGKSDSIAVAFSPDGQGMALIAGIDAREWGLKENRFTGGPIPHTADGRPLAESHDGRRVLLPSRGGEVLLWDAGGHLAARRFDAHRPEGAAADPLLVWDVASGEPVSAPLPYRDGEVNGAAFSPDGMRLAIAASDGTTRVFESATGQALAGPLPQEDSFSALSWSPDGGLLLTAGGRTLTLWDAATGRLAAPPLHAPDEVLDAWFAPDGKRPIAAVSRKAGATPGADGKPHGYLLDPNALERSSLYPAGSLAMWDAVPVMPDAGLSGGGRGAPYTGSPPAWTLDFAEALAGKNLDESGNPAFAPIGSLTALRQRASADANSGDAMAAWAARVLGRAGS